MIETSGRSNYFKCDVVYWDKPVKETCPTCSTPFLLEKTTKRDGTVRYCQTEGCEYKMAVETTDSPAESNTEHAIRV